MILTLNYMLDRCLTAAAPLSSLQLRTVLRTTIAVQAGVPTFADRTFADRTFAVRHLPILTFADWTFADQTFAVLDLCRS